jgi:hypothetical protein
MATLDENERMEYVALMSRGRDAERTSQFCWVASAIAAAILLSWGIASRSAGLMLPAVFAAAFGFYALIHGRQQVRLIGGYVKEIFESQGAGPQWFTRLGHLEVVPGFNPSSDWLTTCLANAVVVAAVVFAWLFASVGPRGELMAGIVTGCGIVFAFHSVSETARLRQTNPGALWRQVVAGPVEERRPSRAASR